MMWRIFKKKINKPQTVYMPQTPSKRDKYIELINMYLSGLREDDMLKILVILQETAEHRRGEETKFTRDVLFNSNNPSK